MEYEMGKYIDTFKNYLNENTNNKMTHKYKLTVKWSNKPDWNINESKSPEDLKKAAETIGLDLTKNLSKRIDLI
jgi:hypothetical protein